MKHFITVSSLVNHLISESELQGIFQKHGYEDLARKCGVRELIDFLLRLPSKSGQGSVRALIPRLLSD